MNTQELIQLAEEKADSWEDYGTSAFAKEHGLTLGYHTDAEQIRGIIKSYKAKKDLDYFVGELCGLDTIVRDHMWDVIDTADSMLCEERLDQAECFNTNRYIEKYL